MTELASQTQNVALKLVTEAFSLSHPASAANPWIVDHSTGEPPADRVDNKPTPESVEALRALIHFAMKKVPVHARPCSAD